MTMHNKPNFLFIMTDQQRGTGLDAPVIRW